MDVSGLTNLHIPNPRCVIISKEKVGLRLRYSLAKLTCRTVGPSSRSSTDLVSIPYSPWSTTQIGKIPVLPNNSRQVCDCHPFKLRPISQLGGVFIQKHEFPTDGIWSALGKLDASEFGPQVNKLMNMLICIGDKSIVVSLWFNQASRWVSCSHPISPTPSGPQKLSGEKAIANSN